MKRNYDTLSEAINSLREEGYTEDFNLKENCIECKALGYEMFAKDFLIDEMFRFEGMSSPDDSSILFAISSDKFNIKGVLVDAYGMYSSPLTTEMIEKLRFRA